jgi:bifunctional DNA-binding transcriptional regulator/antitoxin component of YhaV-PrlF toxin-antitoxin module
MLHNMNCGLAEWRIFLYSATLYLSEVEAMATTQFKLPIGAKRQVTIPSKAMELLSLHQGDDLLLEIVGDRAVLSPAVSVARYELPEELKKKFLARRGAKPTDIPLDRFFEEVDRERAERQAAQARASSGNPRKKGSRATAATKAKLSFEKA